MKFWCEEESDPPARDTCPDDIAWAYRQNIDWDRIFGNIRVEMVDSAEDTGVH